MKTIYDFQKTMSKIAKRDYLFCSQFVCIESRLFENDHHGEKDFFCIAHDELNTDKWRSYYFYSSTMSEPDYVLCFSREDAIEEMKKTINKICL